MFTEEQIKELGQYETYFESAVIADYVRNIPSDKLAKILKIWEEASGEITKGKLTCGVCQLTFFKKVGKHYFKDKKYYASEEYMLKKLQQDVFSPEPQYNENNLELYETKKKPGNSTKRRTSVPKTQTNSGNKGTNKRGSKKDK